MKSFPVISVGVVHSIIAESGTCRRAQSEKYISKVCHLIAHDVPWSAAGYWRSSTLNISSTWFENKSDISYLKASRAFDVPIHSRALLAAILSLLVTAGITSSSLLVFPLLVRLALSASCCCVYIASASQHPSQTLRLLIVATQSSHQGTIFLHQKCNYGRFKVPIAYTIMWWLWSVGCDPHSAKVIAKLMSNTLLTNPPFSPKFVSLGGF